MKKSYGIHMAMFRYDNDELENDLDMAMLGIVSTEFHLDPIQTLSPAGDVLSIIH